MSSMLNVTKKYSSTRVRIFFYKSHIITSYKLYKIMMYKM